MILNSEHNWLKSFWSQISILIIWSFIEWYHYSFGSLYLAYYLESAISLTCMLRYQWKIISDYNWNGPRSHLGPKKVGHCMKMVEWFSCRDQFSQGQSLFYPIVLHLTMKLFSCIHITWPVYRKCMLRILSLVINIKYYTNSQYARILLYKY